MLGFMRIELKIDLLEIHTSPNHATRWMQRWWVVETEACWRIRQIYYAESLSNNSMAL